MSCAGVQITFVARESADMVRATRSKAAVAAADNEDKSRDAQPAASHARSPSPAEAASAAASSSSSSSIPIEPCVICLEPLSSTYAALDQCTHCFHSECILDWAKVTNLCPLCKKRFKHIKEINPNVVVNPVGREINSSDQHAAESRSWSFML